MSKAAGIMLGLFGPDGSGKSTVADVLEQRCENAGMRTSRMHWRPGFLPYRGGMNGDGKADFTNPQQLNSRRGLAGWLVFIYIVMDFVLGYLCFIRPRLRRGIIVIYERYYYDIIMDQKRYGLRVPASVCRAIARLVMPVPDMVILLDAPANILYARKQELGRIEIERQRRELKEYFQRFSNYRVVDVEHNDPDQVADIILAAIDIN